MRLAETSNADLSTCGINSENPPQNVRHSPSAWQISPHPRLSDLVKVTLWRELKVAIEREPKGSERHTRLTEYGQVIGSGGDYPTP